MPSKDLSVENVQSPSLNDKQVSGVDEEKISIVGNESADIAIGLALELDAGYIPSPEVELSVRRKIDWILLPLISCTATLSFLDKVSNNYANNYGLSKDLHMHGEQFSWSASVFYFSFMVFQPLVSYVNQHYPLGKVISINCICWGLILLGEGFVKDYAGFVILRFFQGCFESFILPAFLLMCSIWWTREEQSLRSAFWFNSVAGIFGGLFSYAIGQWRVRPGFELYQYIYVVYGSFTTGWGIMLFFALPDSPVTAWFLTHEERLAAVSRVKRNQTGMINRHFKKEQVIETILDPKTWFFFMFTFISNLVNGGLNAFSTSIIKGFGFSTLDTTLLSMPWGCVSTISNLILGLCISYTTGKRLYLMAFVNIIPIIGTALQFALPGPRGVLLFGFYLSGAYNAPYVMLLALVSSNTAGTTKKVVTGGIVWVAYCVGNIAGPFFFRSQDAPHYSMGVGVMLGSFSLQLLMSIGFRVYLVWLNKQKEREEQDAPDHQEDSATHAFADLTDKQNHLYRYTY